VKERPLNVDGRIQSDRFSLTEFRTSE
jgi:hypothetical protein